MRIVLCLLGAILAVGTIGYTLIEGWPLFDSLYMTTITLATIGYSEIHPLSTGGRAFTIGLSLTGLGVVAYSFSTVTAFVVEGQLSQALRRRKMEARIKELKDHYIICGAGHTAMAVIDELHKTRRPYVIVEKDEAVVQRLIEDGHLVIEGDAQQDESLEKADIKAARGLFCILGSDPDNAFIAISARGLNPRLRIISEVLDDDVRGKLVRSGADTVISSRSIGGLRMVSEMIRPAAVGFLDSMIRDRDSDYRFEEIVIPKDSPLAGKPMRAVFTKQGRAPLILAIKKPRTGAYTINPNAEGLLEADDILVVLGAQAEVLRLQQIVNA